MNKEILKEQIKRHEGEVLEVYADSLGYLTLGVGHLIKEGDAEHGQSAGTPVSQETVDIYYEMDSTNTLKKQFMCLNQKVVQTFMTYPKKFNIV